MNQHKKREHLNDLLIPVILLFAVLPFVVRLSLQDTGLDQFLWYSDDGSILDLYAYVRSIWLIIIAAAALVILAFRFGIYKERTRRMTYYLPLLIYLAAAFLSAVCAKDKQTAFFGNLYRYEGLFVLAGYVILSVYCYQILERSRDFKTVKNAILVMFAVISVIGIFQVFHQDLLQYEWVQRLVMSAENFEIYGGQMEDTFTGNNVYLTLYNPNYAGVFLVMFFALFFVLTLTETERKKQIGYLVAAIVAAVLLWFTYTRATLLGVAAVVLVYGLFFRKKENKKFRYVILGILGLAALLVVVDVSLGSKYLSRLVDEKKTSAVDSIYTKDDGVWITSNGKTLVLAFSEDETELVIRDTDGKNVAVPPDADGEYILPLEAKIRCNVLKLEDMPVINMLAEDYTLLFTKQNGTYYYYNENGKLDQMTGIPAVDFHGLEYLGSGRVYIWSRTLPLLKHALLIGSGPDTFAEAFPQNDYVGKMIYAEKTSRIMEGAHNLYLNIWVQTGAVSLIAFLVFCVIFLRRCGMGYRKADAEIRTSLPYRMGVGCFLSCIGYLVCGFFNDSTLYTTPVFYGFAGIALAGVALDRTDEAV